uniref:Uncharacterized protein n=1 Tax=Skeletonema marinoi TaxID=267567 RepID=A0A7S2LZV4_9STRA|mmetsp:Transcript_31751/g.53745  ORF Transcript_31751/g.53745 Transcript_31751/m.53745 type:complete len:624 (+) Transcript_31751:132-2003(+)
MISNPRINGLHEIPNVLSAEEADKLSNAIDNQHFREWCPEGFDRRNRVQRYSGKDMTDHFGWVFDKIVSASDQANVALRRPLELVITEHTPSSCRSIVNTFEQRELCPCQQQQQQCQCYVAQLTLVNNGIYSVEKPVGRDLECWDLVEPATTILMEQNGVVIKTGESLWEWRGRISDIKDSNSCGEESSSVKGWKKGQKKLALSNKRSVTLSFRGVLPPEPSSLSKQMESCKLSEESEPQVPLAKLLTIIVTTSPIRSNPSTELLERTFDTFQFAGSEFAYECPKVIVCDGCRVLEDDTGENTDSDEKKDDDPPKITRKYANVKQTLRNGIATVDQAKNYTELKKRLHKLCADSQGTQSTFSNTTVVELEERHGYGFALRHALYNCVETPYVCVIQHDRTFMRPTPIQEVVSAMESREDIKYVGVSMKSNLNYYDIFSSKYSRRACTELKTMIIRPEELNISGNRYGPNGHSIANMVEPPSEKRRKLRDIARQTYMASHQNIIYEEWVESMSSSGANQDGFHQLSLTPTLFWYDNTHIVRTEHYRDFIYNPVFKMVARGGFVEDKLSPIIKRSCERLGLKDGHAKFGCYLLDDHSGDVFTGHLDGGSYNTAGLHVKRNASERS